MKLSTCIGTSVYGTVCHHNITHSTIYCIYCNYLPNSFEKAPLQYWCTILLLPASIICAWQRMSFSASSPSSPFSLRRGAGLFGTACPEASSAQQAFLLGSLQRSSHQPPPAPSRQPRAPVTVQHRYSHSTFEGFFPFVSLLGTCLPHSFWNLFFLILFFFFSLFSAPMSFPCPGGCPYETPPFLPAEQALFEARQKLSITVLVMRGPTQ